MSRFRNYGLWLSVVALVPMVCKGYGLNILPDNYSDITNAVLGILVLGGILNNPTTENRGFLDDMCNKTEDKDKTEKK